MRIPRLVFASLIAGIVALACTLAVVKVGAKSNGTVVLLTATGPSGRLMDCPLSTLDKNQATCAGFLKAGQVWLGFQVRLLSREGGRVLLEIRTRTYPITPGSHTFGAFELDSEPGRQVWFEPGEPTQVAVPEVGTLTLTGEWLDHVPVLIGLHRQDVTPSPNEMRFASPLMLKDGKLAGDMVGAIGSVSSNSDSDVNAEMIYIPGEGRFLISELQMKGAVKGQVALSRFSFEDGGHQWELVNGVPITRADHLWVLHEPDFKTNIANQSSDTFAIGSMMLNEIAPGEWVPFDRR